MAVTNEDILERFEIGEDGVVRWRKLDLTEVPRWAQPIGKAMNRKAGKKVDFFSRQDGRQMAVKLGTQVVTEGRIRKVLLGQTAKDVAVERERSARKRAKVDKMRAKREAAKPPIEDMVRAAQRRKWIRERLGFQPMPTGEWLHPDGRRWVDALLRSPEAIAAGEEFDAMEGRDE